MSDKPKSKKQWYQKYTPRLFKNGITSLDELAIDEAFKYYLSYAKDKNGKPFSSAMVKNFDGWIELKNELTNNRTLVARVSYYFEEYYRKDACERALVHDDGVDEDDIERVKPINPLLKNYSFTMYRYRSNLQIIIAFYFEDKDYYDTEYVRLTWDELFIAIYEYYTLDCIELGQSSIFDIL